ncbi:DNA-binding transcription factor [Recurvomyces mirabilis]|nr:DNA-binding transcription factor [Recurvomyces mirabilis]
MAEVLGVAASAIQVADAGFKLYGALSHYVRDYINADQPAKRLADEVQTTSWALQQLGTFLNEDNEVRLCKPEVVRETEAALKGCQSAFDEVRQILDDVVPDGRIGSIKKRWKWPLKKDKAVLLLAQFERLKTTLLLVFKVLSYASKLASSKARSGESLLDDKTQVTYLAQAKENAEATEKTLLAQAAAHNIHVSKTQFYLATASKSSDVVLPRTLDHVASVAEHGPHAGQTAPTIINAIAHNTTGGSGASAIDSLSARESPGPLETNLFVGAMIQPDASTDFPRVHDRISTVPPPKPLSKATEKQVEFPKREQILLGHLNNCITAVARLGFAFQNARKDLQKEGSMPVSQISQALRSSKRAVDTLVTAERDVDSEGEAERYPVGRETKPVGGEFGRYGDYSTPSQQSIGMHSPSLLQLQQQQQQCQQQQSLQQQSLQQQSLQQQSLQRQSLQQQSLQQQSLQQQNLQQQSHQHQVPITPHSHANFGHPPGRPSTSRAETLADDIEGKLSNSSQQAQQTGSFKGRHPLLDYQMALMLQEQQNKKRLLMARQEADSAAEAGLGVPARPLPLSTPLTGTLSKSWELRNSSRGEARPTATPPESGEVDDFLGGQSEAEGFASTAGAASETVDGSDIFDFDQYLADDAGHPGDFDFDLSDVARIAPMSAVPDGVQKSLYDGRVKTIFGGHDDGDREPNRVVVEVGPLGSRSGADDRLEDYANAQVSAAAAGESDVSEQEEVDEDWTNSLDHADIVERLLRKWTTVAI